MTTPASAPPVSYPTLQLPAGFVRLWHPGIGRGPGDEREGAGSQRGTAEDLVERLARLPGIHRLGPGMLAALPVPGDGDVIDAAAACGRRFLTELGRRQAGAGGPSEARVLVYPGRVEITEHTARLLPDDLDRFLDQQPPPLPPGTVHLTTRGGLALETPLEIQPGPTLPGPSGEEVPSYRLGPREAGRPPWRNVEVWGRRPEWLPRQDLVERLTEQRDAPVLRVVGPLGSGKTRAVMETLPSPESAVHVAVASPRSGTAATALRLLARSMGRLAKRDRELHGRARTLARELTHERERERVAARAAGMVIEIAHHRRRGGSPMLTVVLDGLERAAAPEWELVTALMAAEASAVLRLVLVGRDGGWPRPPKALATALETLPRVTVGPLSPGDAERLFTKLLPGIHLPDAVREQLLEAAAGNPFAIEEGVLSLIQHRLIRRFYGAFVYRGGHGTGYLPSLRLTAHVEAEGLRLGDPFPARLLAVSGETVPPRELASAAALAGSPPPLGWEEPFVQVGWLGKTPSPWGPAVAWSWGAAAAAWRETVSPLDRAVLRRILGELLAELGDGEGHWRAYRLLAGEPEAIPLLLRTAESTGTARPTGAPADDLVDALEAELAHHRDRGGDPGTELDLLWRLMPLARRTGRLSELGGEFDRALALAGGDPRRIVALSLLKAELDHDEGRFRQAEQTLRTALENSSSASETQKAVLLVQLGHLLMRQERWTEARKLFERILPTLEGTELRSLSATCRFHLGNIALAESRLDDALAEHQKALEIRRHTRSPNALSASLAALGAVSLDQGRYPEALGYYQEAEEMAHRTGDDSEVAFALRGVGRALARLGDFTSATVPLRRALELRKQAEDVVGRAMARLEVAENYLHLNNPGEALVEARKALFQLSLLGSGGALGNAESLLGRIQLHRRRLEEARRHLQAALERHEEVQDPVEAAFDRAALIRLELLRTEPAEVRRSRLAPLLGQLGEFLETHPYPELGERLDLQMFRALDTLETPMEGTRHPLFYLRRAYETLMRKTGHLPRELRSRFLLQIPDHEAIQTAAHHHGLEIGSLAGDRGAHPGGRVPPRSGGH